jgi:hypothetical protein
LAQPQPHRQPHFFRKQGEQFGSLRSNHCSVSRHPSPLAAVSSDWPDSSKPHHWALRLRRSTDDEENAVPPVLDSSSTMSQPSRIMCALPWSACCTEMRRRSCTPGTEDRSAASFTRRCRSRREADAIGDSTIARIYSANQTTEWHQRAKR